MSFVITSGGTAGHIYPALAVAAELERLGKEVVFAGSEGGMEERLVKKAGLPYRAFKAKGFDRQNPLTLLTSSWTLARSTSKARAWLGAIEAEAVAAFGGYASVPVGRAAVREHIPLLIHEQNSHMGWANRHLSKHANVIALTYAAAGDELGGAARERIELTGNPVRSEFWVLSDAKQAEQLRNEFRMKLGLGSEHLLLLVFGGSRGARHINQTVVKHAPALMERDELVVVHLTGLDEFGSVKTALEEKLGSGHANRWKLLDYCDEMPAAFAAADIVLSRAGASSLAELSVAGKPSLLVPYPYATADHQRKNAQALVEAGAARMVLDAELDSVQFLETLTALIDDEETRQNMSAAAQELKNANAASRVAELLISIAKK